MAPEENSDQIPQSKLRPEIRREFNEIGFLLSFAIATAAITFFLLASQKPASTWMYGGSIANSFWFTKLASIWFCVWGLSAFHLAFSTRPLLIRLAGMAAIIFTPWLLKDYCEIELIRTLFGSVSLATGSAVLVMTFLRPVLGNIQLRRFDCTRASRQYASETRLTFGSILIFFGFVAAAIFVVPFVVESSSIPKTTLFALAIGGGIGLAFSVAAGITGWTRSNILAGTVWALCSTAIAFAGSVTWKYFVPGDAVQLNVFWTLLILQAAIGFVYLISNTLPYAYSPNLAVSWHREVKGKDTPKLPDVRLGNQSFWLLPSLVIVVAVGMVLITQTVNFRWNFATLISVDKASWQNAGLVAETLAYQNEAKETPAVETEFAVEQSEILYIVVPVQWHEDPNWITIIERYKKLFGRQICLYRHRPNGGNELVLEKNDPIVKPAKLRYHGLVVIDQTVAAKRLESISPNIELRRCKLELDSATLGLGLLSFVHLVDCETDNGALLQLSQRGRPIIEFTSVEKAKSIHNIMPTLVLNNCTIKIHGSVDQLTDFSAALPPWVKVVDGKEGFIDLELAKLETWVGSELPANLTTNSIVTDNDGKILGLECNSLPDDSIDPTIPVLWVIYLSLAVDSVTFETQTMFAPANEFLDVSSLSQTFPQLRHLFVFVTYYDEEVIRKIAEHPNLESVTIYGVDTLVFAEALEAEAKNLKVIRVYSDVPADTVTTSNRIQLFPSEQADASLPALVKYWQEHKVLEQ